MVSQFDVSTSPLLDIDEDLDTGCLTYDIGWRSIQSPNAAIEEEKVNDPFWHLKSIQELKKVRTKYYHILWGELKDGYCEEADADYKCKM
jgi:hypothetical protein